MINDAGKHLWPIDELNGSAWVSKIDAAGLLAVRPRQIERLVLSGMIEKRTLPRAANEKIARVVFARADIDKLATRKDFTETPDGLGVTKAELAAARPASQAGRTLDANWLPLADAAELLGVGRRQIERRAAQGMIQKRVLERAPMQTFAPVLYSRADVEAIRHGKPNNHARLVKPKANGAAKGAEMPRQASNGGDSVALSVVSAAKQDANALAALVAALRVAPAEVKPWLTLAEASEFSGLPSAYLRREAKAGGLHALDVGASAAGGRFRFNRESLSRLG